MAAAAGYWCLKWRPGASPEAIAIFGQWPSAARWAAVALALVLAAPAVGFIPGSALLRRAPAGRGDGGFFSVLT
jgi:hypothetical protein